MPFLDNNTYVEQGLFISAKDFFLHDAIHEWMDGRVM
jgi:hypothetical protein